MARLPRDRGSSRRFASGFGGAHGPAPVRIAWQGRREREQVLDPNLQGFHERREDFRSRKHLAELVALEGAAIDAEALRQDALREASVTAEAPELLAEARHQRELRPGVLNAALSNRLRSHEQKTRRLAARLSTPEADFSSRRAVICCYSCLCTFIGRLSSALVAKATRDVSFCGISCLLP